MTELEYKKLLIDMVSMGEYEQKEDLANLLKMCNVTFEKTSSFAYSRVYLFKYNSRQTGSAKITFEIYQISM